MLGLVLIPLLARPPAILVAPEGRVVAVRDAEGKLRVSGGRANSYLVEQFFDEETGPPPETAALRHGVRCDELACSLDGAHELRVAHVLDAAAFPEDCRRADLIITPLRAPTDCGARLVIDLPRLQRFGAHAIRVERERGRLNFSIETGRSAFPRPWQAASPASETGELSTSATSP